MMDDTKFFKEMQKQHDDALQRQRDEAASKTQSQVEFDATCEVAADVFEHLFTAYSAGLRDGDVSIPSRVTRMPKVIEVMDPTSRTSLFGNVYLSLSSRAGETDFELVYLVVRKPSVLGMLAWRGTNADVYFIGPSSKMAPQDLPERPDLAEPQFKAALRAMTAG